MTTTQAIEIVQLPKEQLTEQHFRLAEREVPELADGEVLVENILLSIDAANRAWMQGATYRSAIEQGQVMDGYALGRVVQSRSSRWQEGDIVEGDLGWRELAVKPEGHLVASLDHRPLSNLLSALGIAGKTAWHGLFGVGRPQPGETVLVSAAAGSVGCLVGQMAKLHGCRAVGIAGGPEKCDWLTGQLGFDAAVDYRASDNLFGAIREQCPDGVDLYFDNVGGKILESALFLMNNKGRIVCCGAVSQYDTDRPLSPRGLPGLLVVKRLRMEGFVVMDFADQDDKCTAQISGWLQDGSLQNPEDIVQGLENAPSALIGLLAGNNRGKRMVRLRDDP